MVKWYFNGYKMCILHYQLILMLMRNSTISQQISKHNHFILSKTMEYLAQQATIWHLLSVNNCSQMFPPKSHVQFKTRFQQEDFSGVPGFILGLNGVHVIQLHAFICVVQCCTVSYDFQVKKFKVRRYPICFVGFLCFINVICICLHSTVTRRV